MLNNPTQSNEQLYHTFNFSLLFRVIYLLLSNNNSYAMEFLQTTLGTKDTSCEPVVTSGQHNLTSQHPPRDASPAGLVGIWLLGPFLIS